jgi:hypothetical protein
MTLGISLLKRVSSTGTYLLPATTEAELDVLYRELCKATTDLAGVVPSDVANVENGG